MAISEFQLNSLGLTYRRNSQNGETAHVTINQSLKGEFQSQLIMDIRSVRHQQSFQALLSSVYKTATSTGAG